METDLDWQPVAVKLEPEDRNEEINDSELIDEVPSTSLPKTESSDLLENDVFCSVKVEKTESEDENCSADVDPDTWQEVSCTTQPETTEGAHLESSVFCAVSGLPLVDGSALSRGRNEPTFSERIKKENIKDEDLSAAPYLESNEHISCDTSVAQRSSLFEKLKRNLASILSTPSPVSSASEDVTKGMVKIKKEMTEDLIPSQEHAIDGIRQSSPETALPGTSLSATSEIKIEDDNSDKSFDVISIPPEQDFMKPVKVKKSNWLTIREIFSNHDSTASLINAIKTTKCLTKEAVSSRVNARTAILSAPTSAEKHFHCNQCPAKLKTQSNLHRHLLRHSVEKAFSCNQCPARFLTKSELQSHLLIHSDEKPFSCHLCSAQFKRKQEVEQHFSVHANQKPFFCNYCPARFAKKDDFKQHLLIHSNGKIYTCAQCSAQFKRKQYIIQHLTTHANKIVYTCDQCSRTFKLKRSLKRHLSGHVTEKLFSCDLCPSRFKRESSLKKHSIVHSNKRDFSSSRSES